MKTIDRTRPVMVTGATGTGYLASWVVKKLLEQGIDVNATVRDPSDAQKVGCLRDAGSVRNPLLRAPGN